MRNREKETAMQQISPATKDCRRSIRRRNDRVRAAAFEALETRVLFTGGDGGGADPIFPDMYEPNNSFAVATNLGTTNTSELTGLTIHKPTVGSDVDYFKFVAASSGTVGVEIDFVHVSGNLQLAGYDSAQTQIAFSNSSTTANSLESFSLNVTAGQTYFLKVSGVSSTVQSPDYSLYIQPLSVGFDWSMPKRFGTQLDQGGLPISPNTVDYARPNPIMIGNVQTP